MNSPADPDAGTPNSGQRIVFRNTMYMGVAEVLSLPMSVLLNAMIGRYLGPEDLGHVYLATTIAALAFLVIAWGHNGALPAEIVRDKTRAGSILGTSVAWRLLGAVVVYAGVWGVGTALGFSERQQWALGLVFLGSAIANVVLACQDAVRAFERMEVAAVSRVGNQVLTLCLVVPVLLLGGRMHAMLLAQAAASLLVLVPLLRALRGVGVGAMTWSRDDYAKLMVGGTPFVFFSLALVLQPNVDAFFLARLSTTEVVGWYAVEQRLIGILLMPATVLVGALYPTLCRLWLSDKAAFNGTARGSVSSVALLAGPVTLGCALYPDIGVSIFGRESFRPAEDILRVASVYLFLVYFSMPIGTTLVAAGKQRAWTITQLLCVLNSALLAPYLVSYFQTHHHNGALGLAATSGVSEAIMIAVGVWMMPKGVFDRALWKALALAGVSGLAMAAAAYALRGLPSLAAAPIAVAFYALVLYATGGIEKQQVAQLVAAVRRKLGRRAAA